MIYYLLNIFELIAAITGLVYWNKWKHTTWKWLIIYMWYVIFTETVGKYLAMQPNAATANPAWYFYFVQPVRFLYFFLVFDWYATGLRKPGKLFFVSATIYLLSFIADALFLHSSGFWFSAGSYTVAIIILIILLIRFFLSFTFSDRVLNYKKDMMFWFCIAIIVYYVLSLPFVTLRNPLYANYPQAFKIYQYVSLGLNCIMYTLHAFSFKWATAKSITT